MKHRASAAFRATFHILFVVVACYGALPATGIPAAPIEKPPVERLLPQSDQPRQVMPALDIARAVPYPTDFPEMATTLGFLDGRFVSDDDQALRSIDGASDAASLREAKQQLRRAGWMRRYENRLAAPLPGSPDQFGVQVSSFVVEYSSPQDAASAFAALVQQRSAAANGLVGDESFTLEFGGTTPDTNTEYQAIKLVYRVGPLLCSMTLADLSGAPPSVDAIIAAGQLVAERARIVVDLGTVPLGSMLLQFTERGDARNDVYATRAGVQTRLLSESTLESFALPQAAGDAFVSRLASVVANPRPATETAAVAQAVIEIEGETGSTPQPVNVLAVAPSPEVSMFTALFSFNGDSDAADWLSLASVAAADGGDNMLAPIDSPPLGDESFAFQLDATQRTELPAGFLLMARFGSFGIIQEMRSTTGVSLEGAANMMRQQLACIAQVGCSGVAEVPQSVFGGRDVPLVVNVTSEAPAEAAELGSPDANMESPSQPAEALPVAEPEPAAAVEEPVPVESAADVPEELTEPEIISAPAPEEPPVETVPVDVPAETDPIPTGEAVVEPALTSTPVANAPVATAEPEQSPESEVAEPPVSTSEVAPVATDETTTVADPPAAPPENGDAPAPDLTAAPVPADAPIGATAPPPVSEVVQTPADSGAADGATPDFTEPAPAVTEPDTSNDNGNRESRRDRKKDRERRDDRKS